MGDFHAGPPELGTPAVGEQPPPHLWPEIADLEERVNKFNVGKLPGAGSPDHYPPLTRLIHDLWREVTRLRAILRHR